VKTVKERNYKKRMRLKKTYRNLYLMKMKKAKILSKTSLFQMKKARKMRAKTQAWRAVMSLRMIVKATRVCQLNQGKNQFRQNANFNESVLKKSRLSAETVKICCIKQFKKSLQIPKARVKASGSSH